MKIEDEILAINLLDQQSLLDRKLNVKLFSDSHCTNNDDGAVACG